MLSNAVVMMDINLRPTKEAVETLMNAALVKTTVTITASILVVVMSAPVDMDSF